MSAIVVLCSCPDDAVAERIASALVRERLAACVNRIAAVASTYRWQEEVCSDVEVLLLIKTMRESFPALRERIAALHPYQVPEVIAVPIESGADAYLAWLQACVAGAELPG